MINSMLTPMLALIIWTLIILFWMGFARFFIGFRQAPQATRMKRSIEMAKFLPDIAAWAGDNYNHLHEQPTLFYAICVYSHLVGVSDVMNVGLAWFYVGLRVLHSLVHVSRNILLVRLALFMFATLALVTIVGRNVLAFVVTLQ